MQSEANPTILHEVKIWFTVSIKTNKAIYKL